MQRVNVQQSFWEFCKSKWIRLAPLIIVVTLLGYELHLLGFWGWNWSANIENILLIRDWATYPRWGSAPVFVHPAWYCSVYFLLMMLYFALFKAISSRYLPLIIGITSYVGWRIYVLGYGNAFPQENNILGHYQIGMALMCAGLGYALACAYQKGTAIKDGKIGMRVVYTLVELLMLAMVMCYLYLYKYNNMSLLLIMIAFSWLLLSFVQKRGYIAQLLDAKWCMYLGRYAFSIYVVHIFVLNVAASIVLPLCKEWAINNPWLVLGGIALATMALAILGYHLVEVPVMKWYRNSKKTAETQSADHAAPCAR